MNDWNEVVLVSFLTFLSRIYGIIDLGNILSDLENIVHLNTILSS